MCKCKLYNGYSIFSTEQRVFIYDQYLLTQSASQVRRLFEIRFLCVKIPSHSPDVTPCNFYLWGRLKNAVYKTNPYTLEELKLNIRDEININRGELQGVMGNFIKRCKKMYGQRRVIVPAPLSIKFVSTTICKIVTEMCVVVSQRSNAVCSWS